ncbi:nucleolar protein 8-like [Rhopilema esculentum]|uniref:nucleolar protein 8-like n=1 Tax=Rhopilema esculentum TaxID=499914 RepID=UPI0031D32244
MPVLFCKIMKGASETSNSESHRLFLGNLFGTVTDDDIRDRFSSFGQVGDIQIIQRKDCEGHLHKTFAYVNIHSSSTKIEKCVSLYNKSRWHGKAIEVQKAKEFYLTRLKRERQSKDRCLVEEKKPKSYTDIEAKLQNMKATVPGVMISGEMDWVVGKYRRPLPVLRMRGKSQNLQRIDPSKHCHQLKKIKDDETYPGNNCKLSWGFDLEESLPKRSKNDDLKKISESDPVEKDDDKIPDKNTVNERKFHSDRFDSEEYLTGGNVDLSEVLVGNEDASTLGKGIVAQIARTQSCSCCTDASKNICALFSKDDFDSEAHASLPSSGEHSSSESSVSFEETPEPKLTIDSERHENNIDHKKSGCIVDQSPDFSNLKVENFCSKTNDIEALQIKPSDSKQSMSESKRLNALALRKTVISEQVNHVKLALSSLDEQRKLSNHVEFHWSDEEDDEKVTGEVNGASHKALNTGSLSWLGLDETTSSDDDENARFEIKPHFEGPSGKELFKLNQQKGLDHRFKMDERFLEDQSKLASLAESRAISDSSGVVDMDINEEKRNTLSVLEGLLQSGKKARSEKDDLIQDFVRYDPLDTRHSKYEVDDKVSDDDFIPKTEAPLESNEQKRESSEALDNTYFHINSSLTDLFKDSVSTSFTFLNSRHDKKEEQAETIDHNEQTTRLKKLLDSRFLPDTNEVEAPFNTLDEDKAKKYNIEEFFFLINDERLESENPDGPSAFARKKSIEELTEILDSKRDRFRQDYKRKAKDSVRHRKKLGLNNSKQRKNTAV